MECMCRVKFSSETAADKLKRLHSNVQSAAVTVRRAEGSERNIALCSVCKHLCISTGNSGKASCVTDRGS